MILETPLFFLCRPMKSERPLACPAEGSCCLSEAPLVTPFCSGKAMPGAQGVFIASVVVNNVGQKDCFSLCLRDAAYELNNVWRMSLGM